jgi:hypothetical protein
MRHCLASLIFASCLAGCATSPPNDSPAISAGGLNKVASTDFEQLYVHPNSDLSLYKEIYVTEVRIELARGWQTNQNLYDPYRITDRDIQLIKNDIATEFRDRLASGLAQSGLRIVNTPETQTLTLHPAILGLNINNPDNRQPYQTITLAEVSASMTIALELASSASGETLLRLSDRGATRDYLNIGRQDTVKNRADIGKLLFDWAVALGKVLESP